MTEQKRDLQKDLELCEKATPGPWNVLYGCNVSSPGKRGVANTAGYSSNKSAEDVFQQNENNAEFIAAAREGWPHAIRRAMAAEAELARVREVIPDYSTLLTESRNVELLAEKVERLRDALKLITSKVFVGPTLPDNYEFTIIATAKELRELQSVALGGDPK